MPEYGAFAPAPEGPVSSCCHGQCQPVSLSSWQRDRATRYGIEGSGRGSSHHRALQIMVPSHALPYSASQICGSTSYNRAWWGYGQTVCLVMHEYSRPY
ncbi:similar to FLJ43860 protein (predicted), partial [Rattus norvegicus]